MILWQKAYIKLVAENRDGGTTTVASTATGGGSRTESPRCRSPDNNPCPPSPKSPTKPPSHRSPPPCKSSKSSQKKTSKSASKKLTNEETQEETAKAVKSYVREQLATKPPEKRLKIDPMAKPHPNPVVSDYELQLRKAASKPVPQLGEQPQREYMMPSKDYRAKWLEEAGIT